MHFNVKMAAKTLLLLFSCALLINTLEIDEISCPQGCLCDMVQNLRGAVCIREKLTTIEADIPEQVQFLDFSDNIISQLNDYAFKDLNLVKLVVLNISTNSLSQISLRAFEGLDLLQIIDLSNNVLHGLPEDLFETNLKLLKLFLAGNKFGFLEAHPILKSRSLQVLDISRCVISHLHSITFSNMPSLTTIDISDNFIIQLSKPIFENLPELKSLTFSDNKLSCNADMTDLITYLTERQIQFENICQKVEKFQKLVIQQVTTEKSRLLNWQFDNCDIETTTQMSNNTKCEVSYDNNKLSNILVIISAVCGVLVGIAVSCCYFNCIHAIRRRNTVGRRRRIVRQSFHQPRDDLLLSDFSYNLGQSTPVLSRVRHSTIVK